jgi:ribonuclease HI
VWKNGQTWKGTKTHMGYKREAYDDECAALTRALESASRRQTTPERVTIFTDAQAAIRRMTSEKPGRGQQYALQERKHIAALRRARPGITIEIRWCPAHKGIAGNERADKWAKIAAEEPDTRGVELLNYSNRAEARAMPLVRSPANLKREISKKWAEARQWAGGRTSKAKYRMPKSQTPDGAVASCNKRLASRLYQLKTGHCLSGKYLHWTKNRATTPCWWCRYRTLTRDQLFKECPEWRLQQKILWAEVFKETKRWRSRWKV